MEIRAASLLCHALIRNAYTYYIHATTVDDTNFHRLKIKSFNIYYNMENVRYPPPYDAETSPSESRVQNNYSTDGFAWYDARMNASTNHSKGPHALRSSYPITYLYMTGRNFNPFTQSTAIYNRVGINLKTHTNYEVNKNLLPKYKNILKEINND